MPERLRTWLQLAQLRQTRWAYHAVFGERSADRSKAQRIVLADLARFCHAQDTTFVPGDSHASAQLEGRRQVWALRIRYVLDLSDEDVEAMAQSLAVAEGTVPIDRGVS